MMQKTYEIKPIALARTDYKQKFVIPRQSGLVENIGAIEFLSPFVREELVLGLDEFSYIWVIFGFHENLDAKIGNKTLVNPPKYPQDKKVGVYASRSPHRPNNLGLSLAKLLEIQTSATQVLLKVEGLDLLDKTPIFDIKPYLPNFESKPDAKAYAPSLNADSNKEFQLIFSAESLSFLEKKSALEGKKAADYLKKIIVQSLSLDPRPKQDIDNFSKIYTATIADSDIKFCFRKNSNNLYTNIHKNKKSAEVSIKSVFIEVLSIEKISTK